ncbi:2Fe-2S iron-sulfur cluster-binding protein [Nocardia beijingensis]|uniref:2Fe-2S iron-sulfur cluster-binding protein n=1 Tax=Nocardia beijingensis TaxID=95162 RepID=UPI003332E6F9
MRRRGEERPTEVTLRLAALNTRGAHIPCRTSGGRCDSCCGACTSGAAAQRAHLAANIEHDALSARRPRLLSSAARPSMR